MDPLKDRDDPKADSTVYVGIIALILLVMSVYFVHALYYGMAHTEANTKLYTVESVADSVWKRHTETIETYWCIDTDKNLYAIPIDVAMGLEIERLGKEAGR